MRIEKSRTIVRSPNRLRHVDQLCNEFARALACVQRQLDITEPLPPRRALLAQRLEATHAAFVACAARLDTLAYPDFFLCPELVELSIDDLLGGELFALARFVGCKVTGIRTQQTAIELDDPRRDPVEEGPVVRDDDSSADLPAADLRASDAGDVEMVRRLVEQQQVRSQCERQRERRALAFSTRGGFRCYFGRDVEAMQELREARLAAPALAFIVNVIEAPAQDQTFTEGCGAAATQVPARRNAMRRPSCRGDLAVIERGPARDDLQERGLAGAVASDQADPFVVLDGKVARSSNGCRP